MPKLTVTEKLYRSLSRKITALNREGISTGTLREDIRHMSWRELKKLATPTKTGRSTFKGLKEYLEEEPRREYYRETNKLPQNEPYLPEVETGYNYSMNVLEQIMEYLNAPIPEERENERGGMRPRSDKEIQQAEYYQNYLTNLFYTKANEVGFEELGRRLEGRADEVSLAISKCLYGYGEDLKSGFNTLVTIINGGALSAQEMQEYSDFADSLMGDSFDM